MRLTNYGTALAVVGVLLGSAPTRAQPATTESLPAVATLPDTIPIFPLQDVVLFPHSSRTLHIFEARYRQMVADALDGDGIIGMVLLRPGYESEYEGQPPVFPIGCAGSIADVEELPDGRYLIVLRGLEKFRVVAEDHTRAYRLADVESIGEPLDDSARQALGERRQQLAAMLSTIAPESPPFPDSLSDEEFVDTLAQVLGLDPAERQALLEQGGSVARADQLIEILSRRASVPL